MEIERNVGGNERIARLVVGAVLVVVTAAGLLNLVNLESGAAVTAVLVLLLLVGLVLLVTGATQRCLVNQTLGIDTYAE